MGDARLATDILAELTALAMEVQARPSLEEALELISNTSARLLRVVQVSVRLFDAGQSRLVAVARSGESVHVRPVHFARGEGLMGWIVDNAEPVRVDDAEADPRFARRTELRARIGAFLGAPLMAGRECIGVISAVGGERQFTAQDEAVLGLIAAICAPHVEIARLSRLSHIDPLTGALNRRALADGMVADDDGPPPSMSVIMIDIDHFKRVNDTFGHAAGDLMLRHVTAVLAGVVRNGDSVVRVGGEEFLLVMPGLDLGHAEHVAERARATLEESTPPVAGAGVTVSLGVAARRPGESRDALIERADRAMYAAKRRGRNQVVIAR